MSVVIIGGNERMETRYADICKAYGYDKAKVFVKENRQLCKKRVFFQNVVARRAKL